MLSIIASVLKPDKRSGGVFINGTNVFNDSSLRKKIGFVTQDNDLFDDLTVKDNIDFWASAAGVGSKAVFSSYFVKLLDLNEFYNKRIKALSGGMKRRVAICCALVNDPSLIILDEPFTGLDLYYKNELIEYLTRLKNIGKTIIYTSHGSDEIMRLSDVVYIISGGIIKNSLPAQNIAELGQDLSSILLKLI